MIHQSLGIFGIVSEITFCIGIIIMFLVTITATPYHGKRKIIVFFTGLAIVFIIVIFSPTIYPGTIGIDANGNWYEQGRHMSFEKIYIIPLSGTIPLWDKNLQLKYNLTPEEVISLDSGKDFQERLRASYVYGIEGWDITMSKTSYAPPDGIDPSHLEIVISPSFFYFPQLSSHPNSQYFIPFK